MAKPKINWAEIEARYRCGETPAHIARDYAKCNANMISGRAHREGWTKELKKKTTELLDSCVDSFYEGLKAKLDKICQDNLDVHIEFLAKLRAQMSDITNPYLTDGERTNSLFQTAMNNATKIMIEHLKIVNDAAIKRAETQQTNKRNRVVVEFKRPERLG